MEERSRMGGRGWPRWLVMAAASTLWLALPAQAACTDEDVAAIVARTKAANAAMRAGDIAGYVQAMRTSNAQVPADCRPVLDRLQPMATRCTAEERRFALEAYGGMLGAARAGDWRRMVASHDALERAVSPRCWVAANLRTEPEVIVSCRPAELEALAALAGPMIRATARAAETGDLSGMLQVLGALPSFWPQCAAALQRAGSPGGGGAVARPSPPGNVYDLGNGKYSVPGVGACGPSGCVVF